MDREDRSVRRPAAARRGRPAGHAPLSAVLLRTGWGWASRPTARGSSRPLAGRRRGLRGEDRPAACVPIRLDFYAQGFALSRDGKQAAVAGFRFQPGQDTEGVVRVVNVADGKKVRTWLRGKERRPTLMLAFSADGKLLASLTDEGLFRLEEVRSGEELLRHRFAAGYPEASPSRPTGRPSPSPRADKVSTPGAGRRAASRPRSTSRTGADLAVLLARRQDPGDRRRRRRRRPPLGRRHRQEAANAGAAGSMTLAVSYSPDGKYLVSSSYKDRALILWDAKSGDEVRKLPCPESLHSSGRLLARLAPRRRPRRRRHPRLGRRQRQGSVRRRLARQDAELRPSAGRRCRRHRRR